MKLPLVPKIYLFFISALRSVPRTPLPRLIPLDRIMGGAASFWGSSDHDTSKIVDSPETKFIQSKIADHCIVVFSKTTCSYCHMAKDILNETGAVYEVVELNKEEKGEEYAAIIREITGARTVRFLLKRVYPYTIVRACMVIRPFKINK
jgi:glutaredoxin 3